MRHGVAWCVFRVVSTSTSRDSDRGPRAGVVHERAALLSRGGDDHPQGAGREAVFCGALGESFFLVFPSAEACESSLPTAVGRLTKIQQGHKEGAPRLRLQ